jgi:hypothetical protein
MTDTMLALIPRDRLPGALATFHREGYGPVMRVMDPVRATIAEQLERAGVAGARLAGMCGEGTVMIFVHSPGRAKMAAAIAVAQGAVDVELARRDGGGETKATSRIIESAQQRRSRRTRRIPGSNPPSIPTELTAD